MGEREPIGGEDFIGLVFFVDNPVTKVREALGTWHVARGVKGERRAHGITCLSGSSGDCPRLIRGVKGACLGFGLIHSPVQLADFDDWVNRSPLNFFLNIYIYITT